MPLLLLKTLVSSHLHHEAFLIFSFLCFHNLKNQIHISRFIHYMISHPHLGIIKKDIETKRNLAILFFLNVCVLTILSRMYGQQSNTRERQIKIIGVEKKLLYAYG